MSDQHQTAPSQQGHSGYSIRLTSGAKVALFRNVEPGTHGVVFTSPTGERTRVKLSTEALDALMSLWSAPADRKVWMAAVDG